MAYGEHCTCAEMSSWLRIARAQGYTEGVASCQPLIEALTGALGKALAWMEDESSMSEAEALAARLRWISTSAPRPKVELGEWLRSDEAEAIVGKAISEGEAPGGALADALAKCHEGTR